MRKYKPFCYAVVAVAIALVVAPGVTLLALLLVVGGWIGVHHYKSTGRVGRMRSG